MFIMAAVMFMLAAVLAVSLSGVPEGVPMLAHRLPFAAIPRQFRDGWRALRADLASFLAMSQLIMASTLVLLFAILVPRYMQDVLHIAPNNAAFVFAPTGVGAIVGLRFLPWATRRLGKNRVVVLCLVGIALCLVGLALVKPLAEGLKDTRLDPGQRLAGLSLLQALTMIFAGPMGFAYAFLNAPAQTVLHERAPAAMRGRIFATQMVSANFLSLLPLLFIGGLIDLLDGLANLPGVTIVLLLIALAAGGLAVASSRVGGIVEKEEALAAAQLEAQVPTSAHLVQKHQ